MTVRRNKYMWLGTDLVFEAFKFFICGTPYGVMQVHGYPYDATGSTFIVEMHDDVWRRAGFGDALSQFPPGVSDQKSVARIEELIGDLLQGRRVLLNNSKWQSFRTITNDTWRYGNVVLLGDAAHTAHFSIGSGTKLAMEDALALVACLHERRTCRGARGVRGRAAAGRAVHPARSAGQPRVVREHRPLRRPGAGAVRVQHRHPEPPDHLRQPAAARSGVRGRHRPVVRRHEVARGALPALDSRPPMFQPFRLGALELKNRVVVSPMDMYSARGRAARATSTSSTSARAPSAVPVW